MEKKVKPLVLAFDTAQSQAEYFFNREFQGTDLSLVEKSWGEDSHEMVVMPSESVIIQEFFDNGVGDWDEMIEEFFEEKKEELTEQEKEEFFEWVEDTSAYDNYRYGDFLANHYPMWSTVWKCDEFYVNSDYMDTDKLYALGIGVCQDKDENYYLFIAGCGYSFYDSHWIPLFKKLGWIKYEN